MTYVRMVLYGALVVALLAIGFAGAWSWQAAKLSALKLDYETKLEKANERADAQTTTAQNSVNAAEERLSQQLADQSAGYEARLSVSRAALARLHPCPVPVADIGMLLGPASSQDGHDARTPGVDHSGRTVDTGTVDAAAVIETCEANRITFERNAAKLNACIATYNDVRAIINAAPK
jgi:cytoskeletal protein RodZ